ncbi:MAG: NUDIX domain-containing protein [Candidatus Riflebacteria bacterium]
MTDKHRIIDVAAAVIVHQKQVLLARRDGGNLHNLWEFPGGKLEENETAAAAAERELVEELDIRIMAGQTLLVLDHQYPDKLVRLHFVACRLTDDFSPCLQKTRKNPMVDWFVPENFPLADFCPADKIAAGKLPWKKIINYEEKK